MGGVCRRIAADDFPVRPSSKTGPTGMSGGITSRPVGHGPAAGRRPMALVVRLGTASIFGLTAIVGCSGGASGPAASPATVSATTPPTASSAAPTSAALCSAAAQFRAAAVAIGDVDAAEVGVDGVKAALQNLQSAGRGQPDHCARLTAGHPRLVDRPEQPVHEVRRTGRVGRSGGAGRRADLEQCSCGLPGMTGTANPT
jgi:hypothetical protein